MLLCSSLRITIAFFFLITFLEKVMSQILAQNPRNNDATTPPSPSFRTPSRTFIDIYPRISIQNLTYHFFQKSDTKKEKAIVIGVSKRFQYKETNNM